jgi:hypothetical protein
LLSYNFTAKGAKNAKDSVVWLRVLCGALSHKLYILTPTGSTGSTHPHSPAQAGQQGVVLTDGWDVKGWIGTRIISILLLTTDKRRLRQITAIISFKFDYMV